jgi:type II secretory pathway component GspD/PulD (secretin)
VIEVIPLRDNSGTAIINLLNRLGLYQPKFIHRADPRSRLLMVSGPSSYTEMVRKVATAAEEAEQTNITLIRGTEASVPTALDTLSQSQSEAPALPPPAILE